MRLWKVLGVAGVAGVAATGVVLARTDRRRRALEPDDVRALLHERHQEAVLAERERPVSPPAGDEAEPGCLTTGWGRLRIAAFRRRRRGG